VPRVGPNGQGEIRDRTFENQSFRASGLSLIAAAIVHWNTVYLDRAVQHLRARGFTIPDDLLAHVAPLGWEHIALAGDYIWNGSNPNRLPAATRCSHGVLAASRLACSFERIVQRPHVARQQGWQRKGADLCQHLGSNNRPDVAATSRYGG